MARLLAERRQRAVSDARRHPPLIRLDDTSTPHHNRIIANKKLQSRARVVQNDVTDFSIDAHHTLERTETAASAGQRHRRSGRQSDQLRRCCAAHHSRGADDDATSCKLSCVELGYWRDAFVHHFVSEPIRRSPLINRGYYSRVAAVRAVVQQFLSDSPCTVAATGGGGDGPGTGSARRQIISLGAGYDSLFFHTMSRADSDTAAPDAVFYELDFPSVVASKSEVIARHAPLAALLGADVERTRDALHAARYHLMGVDLRDVAAVGACLAAAGIDATQPTLVLSECALIYIDAAAGDALLAWLARTFAAAAVLTYEQIEPDDAFGRRMLSNLATRGCALASIRAHPTLAAQQQRYLTAGWARADAKNMLQIYAELLDPAENRRIERLEIFDEMEEWRLIQSHYCLVLAVTHDAALQQRLRLKR